VPVGFALSEREVVLFELVEVVQDP